MITPMATFPFMILLGVIFLLFTPRLPPYLRAGFLGLTYAVYYDFIIVADYFSYQIHYDATHVLWDSNPGIHSSNYKFEVLYNFLVYLIKSLGFSYDAFRMLATFFIIYAKLYLFLRICPPNYVFIAFVVYAALFLQVDISYIRFGIASSLAAFSLILLTRGAPKKAIMLLCVAPFIHSAAFLFFIIFVFWKVPAKISLIYLILILAIVSPSFYSISEIFIQVIKQLPYEFHVGIKIVRYYDRSSPQQLMRGSALLLIGIFLFYLFKANILKARSKNFDLFAGLGVFTVLFFVGFRDLGSMFSDRILRLFSFVFPVISSIIPLAFTSRSRGFLVGGFLIAFLFISLVVYPTSGRWK